MDRLKDFVIAKNKHKKLYNVAIQKTCYLKIRVNVEVEKKRINIEKKLDVY